MIVGNLERSMEELYTNLHHLWRFQIQSLMDNRYKGHGNPLVHWLFYKGALLTQDMKKKPTKGNTPLGETVFFTLMKTHYLFIKQLNKMEPYHWPFPISVFKPRVTRGAEWFIPLSFTGTFEISPFQKHCSNPRVLETWENSSFHLGNGFRNVSRKQALWFQPGWQSSRLQRLALIVNMDSSWHSDSSKVFPTDMWMDFVFGEN